jgi:hypothetical protein
MNSDDQKVGALLDLGADLCNDDEKSMPKSNVPVPPQDDVSGERSGEIVIDSGGKASFSMVGHPTNETVDKNGGHTSISHVTSSLHHDGAEDHLSKSEGEGLLEDTSADQKMMVDVAEMNTAKLGDQAASKPEGITLEGDSGVGRSKPEGITTEGDSGVGRIWSKEEHNLFEIGCITYGWGEWRAIQEMIPTRKRKEVKSYAKKYNKQHPGTRTRLQGEHERQQRLRPSTGFVGTTHGNQMSLTNMTESVSLWRGTTMDYKTGMTVVDHLPLPNKVTDVFVPPLSAIPKSTTYSGGLSSPLLSHSTMSYDKSTIAKSHKSTAAPDPASMNSSDDTPNLHTWKRTSTTDASEHESSSPMKKKIKRVYSSVEETPSHEGYWTNEEHSQFEKGIILYGWGNWKRVESCVPTRNKVT